MSDSNVNNTTDKPVATSTLAALTVISALGPSPTVSMVWKDVATITVQAGNYWCGNAWLNVGAAVDWSWVLDTGTEEASTWYYLYLSNVTGTPTKVASKTAPTGRLNTNLSGTTYDANVYLGAFKNDASGDIITFTQSGNIFLRSASPDLTHTGDTNYTSTDVSLYIPIVANSIYGRMTNGGININVTSHVASSASPGVFADLLQYQKDIWSAGWISIVTPQTIWLQLDNGANTIYYSVLGWMDKWL